VPAASTGSRPAGGLAYCAWRSSSAGGRRASPCRTTLTPSASWSRGQVGDADARALADALGAALPHIPDLCGLVYYPGFGMLVDDRPAGGLDLSGPGVLPWFTRTDLVPDMIAFARAGGFSADDPDRH